MVFRWNYIKLRFQLNLILEGKLSEGPQAKGKFPDYLNFSVFTQAESSILQLLMCYILTAGG